MNCGAADYVTEYMPDGTGKLHFVGRDIPDDAEVKVTFAILEAQGGERAYESSIKPV